MIKFNPYNKISVEVPDAVAKVAKKAEEKAASAAEKVAEKIKVNIPPSPEFIPTMEKEANIGISDAVTKNIGSEFWIG